ncbi:uncharacterized protein LOC130054629 isoform X1 [Ostrea edulis]|uniref:uncharacterized protein LOC130054629 isoform X1 n=1 Tax=Ostrea edulis TaxID=37623 RepID=UPI0024AFFFCF|nr:uncharacterized protein LOC130054629 isoform X1 [Ostrea edulis]
MLIKWLGPISTKYAESTKNSNMTDPARGVRLLWERLDRCYGTPEEIEASLLQRLNEFKPITWDEPRRYYDLVDLLSEIESLQNNERYRTQLAVFNTSSGVTPVARRLLPRAIYEKWMSRATNYKSKHNVIFPPFSIFVTFIKDTCVMRNDPSFTHEPCKNTSNTNSGKQKQSKPKLSVKKTSVVNVDQKTLDACPVHLTNHSLNECRTFRNKPINVRRKFLKENNICFGCCKSKDHYKQNCSLKTECSECKSKDHPTALHIQFKPADSDGKLEHSNTKLSVQDGERNSKDHKVTADAKCTAVCGQNF